MDIDYLLLLQNFREATLGGVLNDAATKLSDFVVGPIPIMVAAIVYGLCSKRAGTFFFMNYGISKTINEFVKLFACIYRPGIIDDRVLPAGDSKTMATGYSFPSGHSNFSISVYGTFAAWQGKKRKGLSIIAVIVCLTTLFSRNFLGVHTPQDVIIGASISLVMLIINYQIFKRLIENTKHPTRVLLIGFAFIIIVCLIISFKPYPLDYLDGKLLVSPDKMIPDLFCAEGLFAGGLIGGYVDVKAINYKNPKVNVKGVVLSIILVIPIYFWQKYGANPFVNIIDSVYGINFIKFTSYTIEIFYIFAVIPAIYMGISKKKLI